MYASYINSELKKWVRDPMMLFMVIYPIVFGLLGRYLVPYIYETNNLNVNAHADIIITVLALMVPMIFGAVIAFSILDDRDDNILTSIKVTPLSVQQFLSFKLVMATVFSFIGTLFVIWISDIGGLGLADITEISFLACLASPLTGLFINALSKNKIEGFAVMKGLGMVLMLPIASLFFTDGKELIFAIAPGYWPAKAISVLIRGEGVLFMSYRMYFFLGILYAALVTLWAYRMFIRRAIQ